MLPPTIPTSFVPHTSGVEARRSSGNYTSVLGTLAYILLGIAFVLAIGVFLYGRILDSNLSKKNDALSKAVSGIDEATVQGFVRLRDRLSEGDKLLNNHIALTGFFLTLEKTLPASVRFSNIHILQDGKGATTLEGSGIAKNFNALASASTAFAQNGSIKSAIFSNISVKIDGTVSFALSATLDSKLTAFSTESVTASEPIESPTQTP